MGPKMLTQNLKSADIQVIQRTSVKNLFSLTYLVIFNTKKYSDLSYQHSYITLCSFFALITYLFPLVHIKWSQFFCHYVRSVLLSPLGAASHSGRGGRGQKSLSSPVKTKSIMDGEIITHWYSRFFFLFLYSTSLLKFISLWVFLYLTCYNISWVQRSYVWLIHTHSYKQNV